MSVGEHSLVAAYQGKGQLKSRPSGTGVVTVSLSYLRRLCRSTLSKSTDTANKASVIVCGAWWLIGGFVAFRPNHRGFESRSSRHVGTLSKFLVHNLFITIASAPPRRESALLSLAYIRTKGDIKDQLFCIVK